MHYNKNVVFQLKRCSIDYVSIVSIFVFRGCIYVSSRPEIRNIMINQDYNLTINVLEYESIEF